MDRASGTVAGRTRRDHLQLGTLGGFLQAGQIVWGAFPGVQTWLSDWFAQKDWKNGRFNR